MSAPRLSDVLWSSILALLLSLPASAQSPQHALTIHVTDPAGAPIAGGRVAAALRDDRLLIVRVSGHHRKRAIRNPVTGHVCHRRRRARLHVRCAHDHGSR